MLQKSNYKIVPVTRCSLVSCQNVQTANEKFLIQKRRDSYKHVKVIMFHLKSYFVSNLCTCVKFKTKNLFLCKNLDLTLHRCVKLTNLKCSITLTKQFGIEFNILSNTFFNKSTNICSLRIS